MEAIKLGILLMILFILFKSDAFCEKQDAYNCLKRGDLLDNYPNFVQYDKSRTDSVPYYYDCFLKNVKANYKNYGYAIYLAANYYYDNDDFAKADSLYQIFLKIKQPKFYEDITYIDFGEKLNKEDLKFSPQGLFYYVYNSLCEINLKRNNYSLALKYIKLSEKSPFNHFCGNAYPTRRAFIAYTKARCYLGLNKQNSALMELLPYIFNQETEDYDNIITKASQLLKNKYKDKTKEIVESAFKNIAVEEDKYEGTIYHSYYIKIDGILIYVHRIYPTGDENEADSKKYLWNSDFYNMIKN
ncbi:MAG: hypothetical protein WCR42_12370 [bacterium]